VECNIREQHLSLIVADRWVDDNIVTLLPVDGSGNFVLVTELQRINDSYDLIKVPSSGSRVSDRKTDDLFGVYDEDSSNGERQPLRVTVSSILLVQHVVKSGDLSVLIRDDRELDVGRADLGTEFVDVLDPFVVILKTVGRDTDDLHVALGKVVGTAGNFSEFSGADWREITRVGEQDSPGVADPVMELDRTCGGLSFKVWCNTTETKGRHGGRMGVSGK